MAGGIFDDIVAGGAAAGGKGFGLGLIAWAAYRLVAFVLTFIAGRIDARQAALDLQQERLDVSIGKRLAALERIEKENRAEIGRLRAFVEILAGELRQKDPTNPKLVDISRSLRTAWEAPRPSDTPDDMNETMGRMK